MNTFYMNGYLWRVKFVDPSSDKLIDRTHTRTVATTDPRTMIVYISDEISGEFLVKVLIHELGHCAMISFGLIADIQTMVRPEYQYYAEEWICNFIADYGMLIYKSAYNIIGYDLLTYIPREIENIIA